MKWTKAKHEHICGNCHNPIEVNDTYLSSPYQSFCKPCGEKYEHGDLTYSKKQKGYIDISAKKTCSFCEDSAIGNLHGKSVCKEHIGEVIGDEL